MEGEPTPEQEDFFLNIKTIKYLVDRGLPKEDAERYVQLMAVEKQTDLDEKEQTDKERISTLIRELGIEPE